MNPLRKIDLIKISDWLWEIPQTYRSDMRVPARIYASEKMLDEILEDRSLVQLVNITTLPGIQRFALSMPDVHEGYGFPIGGVAAFDVATGIISPGGIGYDINCGVRLLASDRQLAELRPHLQELGRELYRGIPSGVGRGGRLELHGRAFDEVLRNGAEKMIELGYGESDDLERIESQGRLPSAEPALVSDKAKARGRDQLGTIGAGNHFVEIEEVAEIFDEAAARSLGLRQGQAVILIHTGSRGLGHQIATDYISLMMRAMIRYGISLPDRELACVPFRSREGQEYFQAMAAGANFAWANRQLITWEVRQVWQAVLGLDDSRLKLVYDVAHNIAKVEEQEGDHGKTHLVVHRKGATRSFPGQPVLIPGSMGTASYVLMGEPKAMTESFGSSCHGAGRRLSRHAAKRTIEGSELKNKLEREGIVVNAGSLSGLAEEAPEAYKDIDEVIEVIHEAGIAKKVARLKPAAVIKG